MQHPVQQHETRIPIRRVALGALVALLIIGTPALAEMAEGSYTGDGTVSRTISGVGFQPQIVIVKGQGAIPAVIRVSYMAVGLSKSMADDAGMLTDGIVDLTADGFSIADGATVNGNGVEYEWIAFSNDPGDLFTGFYDGTGIAGQYYYGLGFQPDMMIILPHDDERPQFRTIDMPDGQSTTFVSDGLLSNRLLLFVANGFQVGNDPAVNQLGRQYGLIAWRQNAGEFEHGTYTGDGAASRNIAGPSFGPDWLLIKSEVSQPAIHRPRSLGNPWSAYFAAQGHVDDGITNFSANHFTVGDNAAVNESGQTFYYAAFNNNTNAADLAITIGADDVTPDVGQEITLQIKATNNGGPDDASLVTIDVDLPPGLTYTGDTPDAGTFDDATGIWTLGDLAVDDYADLLITATVDAGTAGQTLSTRTAVAGMSESDPDLVNNEASVDVTVNSVDLELTVDVDTTTPELGDLVTLTASVTNHGPSDAPGTMLQVVLPADLAQQTFVADPDTTDDLSTPDLIHLVWDVPAGESRQAVATYRVERGAVSRLFDGRTGSPAAENDTVNNYDDATLTIPSADLAVGLSVDDATPPAGGTVQITVGLDNAGPDAAPAPAVAVAMPAGLTVSGATPGSGTFDIPSGTWSPAALAAAGHVDLVLDVDVASDQGGASLLTVATASSPRNDPVAGDDTDSITIDPRAGSDLGIAAEFGAVSANLGDTVDLTVSVTNNGPGDSSWFGATIIPQAGLAYQSHTASVGAFDGGPGSWLQALPIAAGDTETLVITYLVTGVDAGPVDVVMAVSGEGPDPIGANDDASATIDLVGSFDFAPAVTFDPATANAGDVVTMRVLMHNAGPGLAPGYTATATPPAGFVYLDHTASTGAFDDGTGQWAVTDSLAALAADTLAVRYTTPAAGSGLYSATVAVPDVAGDGNDTNNAAVGSVTLTPTADLAVTASIAPGTAWPGDQVTLTVIVDNAGPGASPGPVAGVTLPTDLVYVAHDAEVGAFDPDTRIWTLAGVLTAGSSRTLSLDLQVGPAAVGSLAGTVTVSDGAANDPTPANDEAAFALTVGGAVPITVEVLPFAIGERTLLPGGAADDVLRIRLTNSGSHDETLAGLTFHNPVTGGADQATQDAYWNGLELHGTDADLHGTGSFTGGTLAFTGLGLDLTAGESLELTLRGAAMLTAPDGVELRPTVTSAGNLDIPGLVDLQGTWPLVANGVLAVDGMTAAQITLHEVGAEVFQIGSVRNLALDVTIPGNGGMADELIKLNVVNTGNAGFPHVITRVEAWADDGSGDFDPAVDTRIGDLHWTGGQRYEASGLGQSVGAVGQRVFVTVDVAEDALGGTVRLSLPSGDDVGVGMLSGNDGPIDAPVTNLLAQTVSATDRIIVTTAALASRNVAPGEERVPLLHLVARNLYTDLRTVRRLRIRNVTVGDPGATQPDLDGSIAQLVIQRDGDGDGVIDGPEIDPVVVSTTWENGEAIFEGVRWELEPDEVSHLFITASVDLLSAADGDSLGAIVGAAGDIMFRETTVVVGDWPLDCNVRYAVDGMVAEQVTCPAVPPVSLTADEGPVLAFDLTVPGNGYLDDTLETLRLENLGTAVPADIAALDLYDDQNGNGIFEPGTDPLLVSLAGIGQDWVALDVDLSVPAGGRRLFAGLTVASTPTDSATVRLSVPADGLAMASTNDGPRDAAVTSPTSLLMSTAPLLSNISFDLTHSTTEMTVTATMRVQNVGGEDVVNISPRDLAITGDGGVSLISGPLPATLDLPQGATGTFTWVLAGDNQGPVFLTARCEGTSAIGGQPRGSLASGSAAHVVLDPAGNLDLYPVANMPFSINRGQTGVVPMTLTLLNGGGPQRADLRLEQLVVTLDDGDGNPVIPADLFAHVTVNEGVNVYCDRWSLEPSGQTMTLALNPPVVVTDSEPVTLGLRLDILSDTMVDRFRVILQSAGDLTVVDHVSGLSRTVQLSGEIFPVMSATGSIVSQASGLLVNAPVQPGVSAGAGQDDVTLLRLDLASSGDDSASEVKVGGFAVLVTDTLGQALPDASAHLSRIWVEGPLAVHSAQDLTGPADSLVVFELLPQVTVPVDTPVAVTVHGRLLDDPVLGPLRLRLQPTSTFDARDGNNAADVLVTYQPGQIDGPVVTIEDPAPPVLLAVTGALPPVISLGAADVLAMTVVVEHPGPVNTAAARVDSLYLECLGLDRQPQDPDAILDGYRVFWNGEDLAVPVFYQHQHLVIPLGGRELAPMTFATLTLRVDVEAAAPAGGFELVASPTCLVASDVNTGSPVPLQAAPGRSLPATSGLARLQPPSGDVVAGWLDRLPPLLPTGTTRVEALRLVLANPAPMGAAPVELSTLSLRAADRHGGPLAAGAMLAGVTIEADGNVWADLDQMAATDSTITLAGATPLLLHAGREVELVVKVTGRADTDADGLSLGIGEADVVCVHPGSTTQVVVRPAAGQAFPFWTAASGLGAEVLADSYINFPNPFAAGRDETRFAFNLAEPATVSLKIWTPRGESVITLLNGEALGDGLYQDLAWDGRNGSGQTVRNGVYLAELNVQYESGASERLLRKVAVVR